MTNDMINYDIFIKTLPDTQAVKWKSWHTFHFPVESRRYQNEMGIQNTVDGNIIEILF